MHRPQSFRSGKPGSLLELGRRSGDAIRTHSNGGSSTWCRSVGCARQIPPQFRRQFRSITAPRKSTLRRVSRAFRRGSLATRRSTWSPGTPPYYSSEKRCTISANRETARFLFVYYHETSRVYRIKLITQSVVWPSLETRARGEGRLVGHVDLLPPPIKAFPSESGDAARGGPRVPA